MRTKQEITSEIVYSYAKAVVKQKKTFEDITIICTYKREIECDSLYKYMSDLYIETLKLKEQLDFEAYIKK